MKVLFYSTYHFNTETFGPYLEMMQNHIDQGDEVTLLTCNGELSSCQVNPNHTPLICKTCVSFRKSGVNSLSKKIKQISVSDVLKEDEFDPKFDLINNGSIKQFKEVKFESFDIGMAVLSSIVSIHRDPNPDLIKLDTIIKAQWKSALWVYETTKQLLEKESYDLVYVFNGRFAVLRACLRACQHLNTDCFVLEEGQNREHYAIWENSLPHSIEYTERKIEELWQNSGETKELDAFEYYKKRSVGGDTRMGHFLELQKKDTLPEGWDDTKTNIVIFNSSEDEFVAIGAEWENKIYQTQAEGIRKICTSMLDKKEYLFYVRVHPNLLGLYNQSILELYNIDLPNIRIIHPDSPVNTYTLMHCADKVISFGSSVGIEAAAFGKISILAGSTFYMNLGSTFNPKNHEEVVQLILADVQPKNNLGALKYAQYLMKFGIKYSKFKRLTTFEAEMNGKIVAPSKPFLIIRKIGRMLRIRKEQKLKAENIRKVHLLYDKSKP